MIIFPRPLQRMVVGMAIGGLAFVVAGFVQLAVQRASINLSEGQSKLMLANTSPQSMQLTLKSQDSNDTFYYNLTQGQVGKFGHLAGFSF